MRHLLFFIFILTSTIPAAAARDYQGNCDITFYGRSTFKSFHGTVSCQPFSVTEIDGLIDMPIISVRVEEMNTNHTKRDAQMRKMFEEEHFPLIIGSADRIPMENFLLLLKRGSSATTEVSFRLKIRDITLPVTATVTNLIETETSITAELKFSVSLSAYQLQPPSVLGVIKVNDTINVTALALLQSKQQPANQLPAQD